MCSGLASFEVSCIEDHLQSTAEVCRNLLNNELEISTRQTDHRDMTEFSLRASSNRWFSRRWSGQKDMAESESVPAPTAALAVPSSSLKRNSLATLRCLKEKTLRSCSGTLSRAKFENVIPEIYDAAKIHPNSAHKISVVTARIHLPGKITKISSSIHKKVVVRSFRRESENQRMKEEVRTSQTFSDQGFSSGKLVSFL